MWKIISLTKFQFQAYYDLSVVSRRVKGKKEKKGIERGKKEEGKEGGSEKEEGRKRERHDCSTLNYVKIARETEPFSSYNPVYVVRIK